MAALRGKHTLFAGCALALLAANACHEKPPHTKAPQSVASAPSPTASETSAPPPPLVEVPSDAGILQLEDAEAVTPPPRTQDAAALPAIEPPLEQVQETCVQAMGRAVFFTQSMNPGATFQGYGNQYRVYEDGRAFRTLLSLGRLGSVDPQRQRLVRIHIQDRPSAMVTAVVDRGDAVVVSVDVPVYCGGAQPFSPVIDVVLPRSNKPIKVQSCSHGTCVGAPRP